MTTHPVETDTDSWVSDRLAVLSPAVEWNPNAATHLAAMHARRASQRARRLRGVGLAVAAAVIFCAVPVTRAFGARCLEACVNATRPLQFWRADEPLANVPKQTGFRVGDLAPDFVGTDASGHAVSLASLRGHVVVLNF